MKENIIINQKIVVEIREGLIKVIQLNKNKILNAFSIDFLGEFGSEDNIKKIKNKLNTKNIKYANIYLIINNNELESDIISIPILKYKYQIKILEEKYNSYQDNSYIQYSHMGEDKLNTNYIVYIISKGKVKKYKDFIEKIGFKAKTLDVKSNTYMKLVNYNEFINKEYNISNKKLLILDFQKNNTNLIVLNKGIITTVKSLDGGANYILNNKIESIMEETTLNLDIIIIDGEFPEKLDIDVALFEIFKRPILYLNELEKFTSEIKSEKNNNYLSMTGGIIRRKRRLNGRYKFF